MNVVMIIPTGIGCEIGGHAGDATPAARLLGSVCHKLLLHPNVVNASDINEMPPNALYVEGSILDRFLEGKVELQEVRSNRILVAVNKPAKAETINAVSATRSTLGIDAEIIELNTPLRMVGKVENHIAGGEVIGWEDLVAQVLQYDFDALAIASLIEVVEGTSARYFSDGGINPWGGVEAIASRLISTALNKPVAHAPVQSDSDRQLFIEGGFNAVCDPRMAAEIISQCFLHCVLKGLHKAPQIGKGISVGDMDVMVSPVGCWGRPHTACVDAGIPIIFVRENTCVQNINIPYPKKYVSVANYLEAAGMIACMREGIHPTSVRRPLPATEVI